jgi:hypothetical protein
MWGEFEIKNDGILYKMSEKDPQGSIIFSNCNDMHYQGKIVESLHNTIIWGHLGTDETYEVIKRKCYWPGMANDVKHWCQSCDFCARRKPGPGFGRSPLQSSLLQSTRPLDRIAIDILGGLPKTNNGNEYIIVVGDYFSKWKEPYAVSDHTAYTVADKLATEFFSRFGIPNQIHTDQGGEFESQLFSELCKLLGIEKN